MGNFTASQYDLSIRREVGRLLRHNQTPWKEGAVYFIKFLSNANAEAVIFGGAIRSLLYSRLEDDDFGRPRDIDIVVADNDFAKVFDLIKSSRYATQRLNRFGGLDVSCGVWHFDIWPLGQTYLIKNNKIKYPSPTFSDLPYTTFLNVESIAVDLFVKKGKRRNVYSGDGVFYRAFEEHELDIVNEANPFPELCVIRSLKMAMSLGWKISPKLAAFLNNNINLMSCDEFMSIQSRHYGAVFWNESMFAKIKNDLQELKNLQSSGCIKSFEAWDRGSDQWKLI